MARPPTGDDNHIMAMGDPPRCKCGAYHVGSSCDNLCPAPDMVNTGDTMNEPLLIEDFPYRNLPLAEWHLVDDNGIVLIRLPQGGGIIFSNSFIAALRKRLDETEKETTE